MPLCSRRDAAEIARKGVGMDRFVKVGTKAELADLEGGRLVEVGGQKIAIFNLGGHYYVIENTCPHRGGPLALVSPGERRCGGWEVRTVINHPCSSLNRCPTTPPMRGSGARCRR